MARPSSSHRAVKAVPTFDARLFLDAAGIGKTVREYRRGESIFTQGDSSEAVFYIQTGGVSLSVLSGTGQEAVVAVLGPGDFFGEACLADQLVRSGSARALTPSIIRLVPRNQMAQLLHKEHTMSDRFIAHLLSRNVWIEEDLVRRLWDRGTRLNS